MARFPKDQASRAEDEQYAECLDASKGVAKPIPLLSFAEQHFPANDCENEQPEANGVELERPPFRCHPIRSLSLAEPGGPWKSGGKPKGMKYWSLGKPSAAVSRCWSSATGEKGLLPKFQKYQRDLGVEYLYNVAASMGRPDNFAIAALNNGTEDIYVHAKLMIIDDEFVLMGSANVNQKSMTHDSELDVGIVDADGIFAKDLRKALWAEHLSTSLSAVDDSKIGFSLMRAAATKPSRTGHIISYNVQLSEPLGHKQAIARIDPYAGPPR